MASSDYEGVPDPGSSPPNKFYFSPCKNSVTCSNSSFLGTPSSSPVCQLDGGGEYHGCGLINQSQNGELNPPGTGFWVTYFSGDPTKFGNRQANISCVCGNTESLGPFPNTGANGYEYLGPDAGNVYGLQFTHRACCPGGGGGGFDYGWLFVIIVLGGAVLYLLVGVVVNRFAFHHEGMQMLPHSEFWASAPGLMKDGVMYLVHKVRGTSGYSSF